MSNEVLLSVVCTVHNGEEYLEKRLTDLSEVLKKQFQYYEILVIDNASTDQSPTIIQELLRREKNIQYCALSTARSEGVALTAGLDRAIGDFVLSLDLRIDPPEIIPEMFTLATDGAEIVYGLPIARVQGRGLYNKLAKLFFRFIARLNNVEIPQAMSTYRLLSRSVLNFILESSDHHRILPLAPALSGYSHSSLNYERIQSEPERSRKVGRRALFSALSLVFSTSVRPLRFVTMLSLGVSMLTVIYAIYVVGVRLLMDNVAEGWAALSLQVSGLFFLISIVLAVMCEYLLQMLETTIRRPVYHIARELQSSTIDNQQELNVIESGNDALGSPDPVLQKPKSGVV
jgi:glycosyltransferase involved in cell wall biosynthesis